MTRLALAITASIALSMTPTIILAHPIAAPAAFDHIDPPFPTDPVCEARARVIASREGPVGSPEYNYAYTQYIFDNCPVWG